MLEQLAQLAQLMKFRTLVDQGRYREAREVATTALRRTQRQHPADGVAIASWLNPAGHACLKLGEYAEASALLEEARDLLLGNRTLETRVLYANCVTDLGAVRRATGRFLEARALHEEALAVRRELPGWYPKRDTDVAQSLSNIAAVLHELGEYSGALAMQREALDIDVAKHTRSSSQVAQDLNNIGSLMMTTGDYAESASCHREALSIRTKLLPANHPAIAESLANLATLALTTRNFDEAERLYREVLEIKAAAFGEASPQAVRTLHNLAAAVHARSQYSDGSEREAMIGRALALENRALKIVMSQADVNHPDSASVLRGIAYRFLELGNPGQAEVLFTAALEITRKVLGRSHREFAEGVWGRGSARVAMGGEKLADAEQDLRDARDIMLRTLGEAHPDVAAVLAELAQVYAASGRDQEALEHFRRAMAIDSETIGQVFTITSEAQRAAYIDAFRWQQDLFLSFAAARRNSLPACVPAALELVLRRKGIEAEMLGAQRDTILRGQHPEAAEDLRRLFELQAQIARKLLDGSQGTDPVEHQRLLLAWRAQQAELEVTLTLKVPELLQGRISRTVTIEDVGRLLPDGSALVEIVRVTGHEARWLAEPAIEARYLAFVLPAGDVAGLRLVELGSADLMDDKIRNAFPFSGTEPDGDSSARRRLREILLDPLLPHLNGRSRLLISPDGAVQFVPFGLLEGEDGTHLIDAFRIDYLSSGRDLVRFTAPAFGATDPVIVADPDFDLAATPGPSPTGGPFTRRTGFAVEAKWLGWKLGIPPWLGADALKGRVRRVQSPQILHFATHGFVEEPVQAIRYSHRWLTVHGTGPAADAGPPLVNPLLYSGLALAGANTAKIGGAPAEQAEDGVLTAEDVTSMDLRGTELVTLSACDTGRGGLRAGEGVLGMRRSFTIAGARVLIMSLFQVPDKLAFDLTRELYTRLLEEPVSYAEALRSAQLAVKRQYPGSIEWGYFICQGDPELRRKPIRK